ncbi:PREDICTED: E3 UFM1-protein ligase 1 homolog isoform X1 [Rhagoletis zephyria]|uniref:E3 UFM1-protein ligase 1 homolog isoform X1 n=1 Tax=Rhagoletis zephyria TaxID=28612 RepID=UPI0008116B91|nr:PREDICTED: E3 UFM1-protein ligase 1 homolog isoform X1 [Rhagoletis zephyria]XP_017466850.1 PREDICTED: E3 UFM1-protein ligase 1 homolog isoform X1 [Rhagoletis zephyria]
MSADWDEIKRLAADFQKAQLTSTLQRLSERNCVEIVTLLLEKNLLEAFFTNDGKEYITPEQLEREVQDELYVNGGRINLVEVSKTLNVDLSRIEEIGSRIAESDTEIYFKLGQLISEQYITRIAEEINERLSQKGEITISDLAQQFDLPSDFLQHDVVEKHLGKIIRGRQDPANPRVFFTQAYIQRCKAKIRGALKAITRPTNVATILQQINVQEKIFHSLFDEIAPAGNVTSKQPNAQYIPHIYTKMQADWVNSFYKQNGFLEYEVISKLGVSEVKQFIRKQFPNEDIIYLKRCAIGSKIIDLTVLSSLNECSATKSFVDLATILPSNMSEEDIEEVFETIISRKGTAPGNFVFLQSIVFSQQYLNDLIQPCHNIANANAKTAVESGVYQQYLAEKQLSGKSNFVQDFEDDSKADKREERRKKAATGKAGGGSQGRETKTKSTKKHQRGGRGAANAADSDDDQDTRTGLGKKAAKSFELVKVEDIAKTINKTLEEEGLEYLSDTIAALYYSQLNQIALAKAQELFEATPQTNRRQTHAAIQERINTLIVDLRLYEKGLKLLPADTQTQLIKYLLKSLGNDICNELTAYIASESNLTTKITNLNVDQRNKIAQECDPQYKLVLFELNKALNKTVDDFVAATESALKACSMIIKKVDKKKDRQLILQHREKLLQQLQETVEPALVLHLVSLILFTTVTGCILHASGKFVAQILAFVRPSLSNEQNEQLMQYHDLVLKLLQATEDSDEAKLISEQLQSLQNAIKELAACYEKPGTSKTE